MLDHIPKELTSVSDDHKTPPTRILKFSSIHSNAHHHPELEPGLIRGCGGLFNWLQVLCSLALGSFCFLLASGSLLVL